MMRNVQSGVNRISESYHHWNARASDLTLTMDKLEASHQPDQDLDSIHSMKGNHHYIREQSWFKNSTITTPYHYEVPYTMAHFPEPHTVETPLTSLAMFMCVHCSYILCEPFTMCRCTSYCNHFLWDTTNLDTGLWTGLWTIQQCRSSPLSLFEEGADYTSRQFFSS